ncbi:precorrin-4 C(11)-methyltransferase [Odoribacter sp. OttesenSCG-928-J03]|nr:precorrin-4 C(11)-methyltransferase [Odoribacter sp. OttesenSCG-928-J03]MDL2330530.1 precorrin-4 C(11)-methyltransferase [Odoribacter sp. OttesenSCG-928-A06]
MTKTAIIVSSETGISIAKTLQKEFPGLEIYSKNKIEGVITVSSLQESVEENFNNCTALIFVGAIGICVRLIAPHIKDKHHDPAVINIDSTGRFVVSVLSGHIGGANELTERIARIIGAEAVISTQSDNTGLWALDTLGKKYHWTSASNTDNFNTPLSLFVNRKSTALLLECKDEGTAYLERTRPEHVTIYYSYADIDFSKHELLIAVGPYLYPEVRIPVIYYHPAILHLGIGCRKNCKPDGIAQYIATEITRQGIAPAAIKDISSIDLKKDEGLLRDLQIYFQHIPVHIYTADELQGIQVPNPSKKVEEVTSIPGVCESTAMKSAGCGPLILEKQKGAITPGNEFTFALAVNIKALRRGHIEIVGAGPGDPDLVSVRGRQFLENADLILYAGSLVPVELTYCAKSGAIVRSSANMALEEQFELMRSFYDAGQLVVRLHTGDPCIYGAIQEQMAFFDRYNMSYHITPGISSFQAAAAALKSQFTIPEKVQTIILTRGEGRTPMPEKEKLHLLARSQSTMCIFLSAGIVEEVQKELLEHYPPETPVAACYKLTWKDERIYRGQLKDLVKIITENKLTLTTMIVVGESIDNRKGLSKLYSHQFKHLFRP